MHLQERINAFCALGEIIQEERKDSHIQSFWKSISKASIHNPWFTEDFCKYSINSIAKSWLNQSAINEWIQFYPQSYFQPKNSKKIGVVMAGNVPFVGFHDLLSILITGNIFIGKVSSKDGGIFQSLIDLLISIEPRFSKQIFITEGKLEDFDAVIATGSDNSARYFDYYFGKYPNIIRKNRHSIAVINGNESEEELSELANDIFLYFGLGCRNVSKVLVPSGYNIEPLMKSFEVYNGVINHNKYANNYEYHRAIYLLNQVEHFDNGFVLVKPDETLGSPVGVLFIQYYNNVESVNVMLNSIKDTIQCVVSNIPEINNSIPFGKTQKPELSDYSDGIDTIAFLATIL